MVYCLGIEISYVMWYVFHRPGVAGAVLQRASSLIDSFIALTESSSSSQSSKYHKSQAERARELTFLESDHPPPRLTCHVSGGRSASRWRVCYQRGLPRLVSLATQTIFSLFKSFYSIIQYLLFTFRLFIHLLFILLTIICPYT